MLLDFKSMSNNEKTWKDLYHVHCVITLIFRVKPSVWESAEQAQMMCYMYSATMKSWNINITTNIQPGKFHLVLHMSI